MGRTADLLGNRNHRCPARRIFPAMLQHHPYRPGAHLGGELVRCLAHQALSYLGVRASDRPGAVPNPSGALLFEFRFTPKRPCRNWQAKLALASGLERAAIGGNMSAPSPNTPRSRTTRSTSRSAKNTLLRTPVATKGGKSAGIGVPGFYQSGGGDGTGV